ncbi:putative ubiquinone biosynthesis protein UbiB [Caballeronia temeraria]|uniref:Ubiquinone biosynthesis protein UbiB n=1 Tax=Caballeronia temeraria TaxID=1777137 RepID=A0A157ZXA4_9BURK|nr:AarF/UbiB family protein [Caballeronia temeraria]SAK50182.1 putative ubiquinone biosynthesis protein UbiB [Caballeronia temeraria]
MLVRRLATLWRLGRAFVHESHQTHQADDGAAMTRVARFFASHGARAAPLGAGVPALSQLSRVLENASGALARHPALAETAVRVALSELDGLFTPHDAARFRTACAAAFPATLAFELTDLCDVPLRSGVAEQTHVARIGTMPVRVTLLRADAHAELEDDLDLALAAARFAERRSAKARELHPVEWVRRARESVDAMIDLRQRAADQSYLRFRLRDDDRLAVPEVLWDYCNDAVLTTRAIETAALSDADTLAACGLDRADVLATLIEAFFEMALGVGLYHAGLDAAGARVSIEPQTRGQIVLESDNPMMIFAAHERDFIVGVSQALMEGDHKAAARAHLEHGRPESNVTHHEVRVEATYRREAERFASPASRRSAGIAHLFGAIGKAPAEHMFSASHGRIASRAVLLSRAAERIERVAQDIAPDVDVWKIARRVIVRLAADQFSLRSVAARFAHEATHWPHTLPRLPSLIAKRADASTLKR